MAWKTALITPVFACIENPNSPFAVLGIPLDHTGTYRPGARFAPSRVREAACNLEVYSILADVSLEDIGFRDYGDIILQPGVLDKALERIEVVTKNVLSEHNKLLLIIGGEHLLTLPVSRALGREIDTLVVFDAHLDMRDEYLDSRVNHATYLKRILEERDLNVIHIGSRAYSKGELETAKRHGVTVYNILDVYRGVVKLRDLGRVYVSIDIDVLDPSIAPGVGNPEPPGLSLIQLLEILREVFTNSTSVRSVDVVEINPLVDHGDVTSITGAKILLEIAGLYWRRYIEQ